MAKYCATPKEDTLYIYPSANNCSSFIVCYHNEEIEMSCLQSSLFMFSEERICLEKCSIINDAKMGTRTESAKPANDYMLFPAEGLPNRSIICPLYGSTRAAIPQECNEYIECNDGIGTRRRCNIGSKFNPSFYKCVPEDESNCKVDSSDSKKTTKGSYVNECRFEKDNSALVFPSEKCSEFVKCVNHTTWTIPCAQGTIFSREMGSCEWEDEVECEQ